MLADRAMRSTPGRIMRAKTGGAVGYALQSAAQARVPSTGVTGATAIGSEKPWVKMQIGGKYFEVHPDDVNEVLQRDPTARVLQ